MVFSSHVFLFAFLPLVLACYALSPRPARSALLVLASCVFYAWWRADFLLLMLGSTALDYACGERIHRAGGRAARARGGSGGRGWLLLSVIANLTLLAYFKYANFGVENLNTLLAGLGWPGLTWPQVVLPVGISFYTFQTLSYSIDIYRGDARPQRRFVDFACYVTLFPQLVAGPIVRYSELDEQLRERTHSLARFASGVLSFQIGLAKKVLLADSIAPLADRAFGASAAGEGLGAAAAWLGTLAYALQIYFDFSGYSDMAIGLGRMFGFEFPENFDAPYRSLSITEFWRRWHMTLSRWLRDYLYIPLGGNRRGPARTQVNLALTMLLGGLWHGAAWTFVIWGAWQGLWLILERALGGERALARFPSALRWCATFALVLVGWVFFRAEDLPAAWLQLRSMAGAEQGFGLESLALRAHEPALVGLGCAFALLGPTTRELLERRRMWLAPACACAFALALLQVLSAASSPFLYFRF
jgi:alginate O-acetyltransferase complex protein AlgI